MKKNVTFDNVSEIQNSINSIVNTNNESTENIKDKLEKINIQMDNVLKQQTSDHEKIKTTTF